MRRPPSEADNDTEATGSSTAVAPLTIIRLFDNFQYMKTVTRIPLAKLQARDSHVEAFGALAHLTRLQAFFHLVRARGEVSVGEVQEALAVPGPTLSHHLDVLRRAGLVRSRKEERYVYYSVRPEMVSDLVRLLTVCC